MTAVAWERPARGPKRRTRRDAIFEWVCRYADEMDGPTPSINEIALHFKLNYKTVYYHVMKLIVECIVLQRQHLLLFDYIATLRWRSCSIRRQSRRASSRIASK
jgi:hypothetical protein